MHVWSSMSNFITNMFVHLLHASKSLNLGRILIPGLFLLSSSLISAFKCNWHHQLKLFSLIRILIWICAKQPDVTVYNSTGYSSRWFRAGPIHPHWINLSHSSFRRYRQKYVLYNKHGRKINMHNICIFAIRGSNTIWPLSTSHFRFYYIECSRRGRPEWPTLWRAYTEYSFVTPSLPTKNVLWKC